MNYNYKEMIENRVKYAADSYNLNLMHHTYGVLEGLHMAEAIDEIFYFNTSCDICKNYFNNAAWTNECHRRYEL